MLRIKEEVNLKELEKFGLKYKVEDDFEMYEWISERTDRFEYVDVYVWNREITVNDANDVLFDIIQAGLVEKCEVVR